MKKLSKWSPSVSENIVAEFEDKRSGIAEVDEAFENCFNARRDCEYIQSRLESIQSERQSLHEEEERLKQLSITRRDDLVDAVNILKSMVYDTYSEVEFDDSYYAEAGENDITT